MMIPFSRSAAMGGFLARGFTPTCAGPAGPPGPASYFFSISTTSLAEAYFRSTSSEGLCSDFTSR